MGKSIKRTSELEKSGGGIDATSKKPERAGRATYHGAKPVSRRGDKCTGRKLTCLHGFVT